MGWISWIVVGLIAGLLAKWIMPGNQSSGIIGTTLLGIAGGVVGGWVMSQLTGEGLTGFSLQSMLVATLGALIVLFVYGLIRGAMKK